MPVFAIWYPMTPAERRARDKAQRRDQQERREKVQAARREAERRKQAKWDRIKADFARARS